MASERGLGQCFIEDNWNHLECWAIAGDSPVQVMPTSGLNRRSSSGTRGSAISASAALSASRVATEVPPVRKRSASRPEPRSAMTEVCAPRAVSPSASATSAVSAPPGLRLVVMNVIRIRETRGGVARSDAKRTGTALTSHALEMSSGSASHAFSGAGPRRKQNSLQPRPCRVIRRSSVKPRARQKSKTSSGLATSNG